MDVYGLTGGIGSGKSAAAEIFEDCGIPVVSVDELSRVVVTPRREGLEAIVAAFGQGVLDDNGELDRATLRDDRGLVDRDRLRACPRNRRCAGHMSLKTTRVQALRLARTGQAALWPRSGPHDVWP